MRRNCCLLTSHRSQTTDVGIKEHKQILVITFCEIPMTNYVIINNDYFVFNEMIPASPTLLCIKVFSPNINFNDIVTLTISHTPLHIILPCQNWRLYCLAKYSE